MVFEFKFPDIGEGITEGDVVKWLVKEGDVVKADQPLAEIETDKSLAEIPSPKSGTILKIHVQAGEKVKVGQVLVTIGDKGEKVSSSKSSVKVEIKSAPKIESKSSTIPPKKIERKTGSVVGELEEANETTEFKFHSEARKAEKKILISPKLRKLAQEKNIDLNKLDGSGENGRITEEDLKQEKLPERISEQKILVKKKYDEFGYLERIPLKGVRKVIADNVKLTQIKAAQVTTMDDIDITKLWKLKESQKKAFLEKGMKLTLLPFIIKAIIASLKEHPILNSSLEVDEILIKKYYNIGIAVETDVGLMVPVIKIADGKDIPKLAKEIVELAEKAKTRKIDLMDLKGSTFSITNYGSVGGKYGTPIINGKEAAILGVGRAFDNLYLNKAGITMNRKMLPLSLTFDHRILDGAEASRFIETLKKYLEDPEELLLV